MKTVMFLIAVGMLIVDSFRPSPIKDQDDDDGLFIGSARPLAAKPQANGVRRETSRAQKRSQLG